MDNPFRITPAYDLLLRGSSAMPVGIYQLHLATAAQLTRLHYKAGMLKTVKKRLKLLADSGYVQADCVPTKQFKSPYYYVVGTRGLQYLSSVGVDVPPSDRAAKEVDHHYLFVSHALELNDILIAALRLKSIDPRYYLARYRDERELKHIPYKVLLGAERATIIPDMILDFRQSQTSASLPLIIEHDRGTEQQRFFRRRIRGYRSLMQSGAQKQLFGLDSAFIAFTTFQGLRRVQQMREWTRAEIAAEPHIAKLFLFADLAQPLDTQNFLFERRWYTLTDNQPTAILGER